MKRVVILVIILTISAAGIYLGQHRERHDVVSPNALVNVAADWQRDVSRVPMQITRISDAEEIKIGSTLAAQYQSRQVAESAETRATEAYINIVGDRVSSHAKRHLAYHFHLVPDPNLINAFALPGGQILVGQGLLDQLTSEDELAFVLGHEIEHVDHYHAVERIQVEAQLHHFDLDLVAALTQIPISLWQAGYSKDEEMEADREGLRIAVQAGYSAQGALKLLERWITLDRESVREYVVQAHTPQDELSQVAIQGLAGYFRSHPLPSERLAQAEQIIAQDHLNKAQPLHPFHLEYEVTSAGR